MRGVVRVCLAVAAVIALLPAAAFAQEGTIAGTVRDSSGAVMPGVTVEVTSPALIEKVRSAVTDANGQYRIPALPIGTYTVTFSLEGFTKQQRADVILTSGFTAPINATMSVGQLAETLVVTAESPAVDVQNARQAVVFEGEQLRDLPTNRNVNSLLALTPGINSGYQPGTLSGVCSGGVGVFCNPGVTAFNQGGQAGGDTGNLSQGRVMVDGQVVNSGGNLPIVGAAGGYTADLANAQEVNIQLSGALGESETGGASINIIPRTGGNRYAGDFNVLYTRRGWFDQNNSAYAAEELGGIEPEFQAVLRDHDVSGAFGGPIKRDRLWFYSVARDQRIRKLPVANDFWPNLNEGKFGFNYQPDRSKPRVEYENIWRNVNARITWQATQRNKFNIFWDEQDFCQDPCLGVVSVFTSPESWWSVQSYPNRLAQVSWTNPWTNKVLLEAGLSTTIQKYRTDEHREYRNPTEIPRIVETCQTNISASPLTGNTPPAVLGCTAGGDAEAGRVNGFAGNGFFALTSASLNSSIAAGGAEVLDSGNYRMRASGSYVTGTHHAKIGYDGAYFTRDQTNQANDSRLTYNYSTPLVVTGGVVTAPCLNSATPFACGNTSLQFPNDPTNRSLRPVPASVTFNTGEATLTDTVQYHAFYAQDQWTLKRLTVSGSLRYDHAASNYGSTVVAPDLFTAGYTLPASDGVSYNDFSPRWGVAYDVFGNGRTSLKWNMGKGLNAATISGIYSNANPARRTVNSLTRNWTDPDGDRIVECDLLNPNDTRDGCGTGFPFGNDPARFGRDPLALDAAGNALGLNTIQCGRQEQGINARLQTYCDAYGDSMLEGWGRRRYEWQLGIGVQHEILPRLSGEVTYNRRSYYNLTLSDVVGRGCDQFAGSDYESCRQGYLNYQSNNTYDFYSLRAPVDPRLPGGGGYLLTGLTTGATTMPDCTAFGCTTLTAQTFNERLNYAYNGIDTNFVWRGPRGLRVNGGTSTGRTNRDDCETINDWGTQDPPFAGVGQKDSPLKGRDGAPYLDGCLNESPFMTRVNGSAAYVIPWVDVLVSTVFQSFPGVERTAIMTFNKSEVIWNPESAARANLACTGGAASQGSGCLGRLRNEANFDWNLLNNNELYGERITLFDLKFAKNIRFNNKRATVGVDIYNLFNSDAIQGYENDYEPGDDNEWGLPDSLVSPRFVRLQVQFNW
ncbi:MAG TPA: carboxypeptidase regulatory-like domain-containing protein [Vicinamibacterales bacterium]|nr:carboxypeptidase regulatory-like domain-containing protein [Vicinamibacterales bacterium]